MKISSVRTILIVALSLFALSLGFISHFISKKGAENGPASLAVNIDEQKPDAPLPVRLRIPSIGIDAAVEYVGLTAQGAMDVPSGPSTVAWLNLGPRPGEVGSSVIDGHSGYKYNKEGVFDNLDKLKKGDKVYIEDEKGATTTFVVREMKSVSRNINASYIFSSNDGLSHLNLISCVGDWDAIDETHTNRLIVFTDKEI